MPYGMCIAYTNARIFELAQISITTYNENRHPPIIHHQNINQLRLQQKRFKHTFIHSSSKLSLGVEFRPCQRTIASNVEGLTVWTFESLRFGVSSKGHAANVFKLSNCQAFKLTNFQTFKHANFQSFNFLPGRNSEHPLKAWRFESSNDSKSEALQSLNI